MVLANHYIFKFFILVLFTLGLLLILGCGEEVQANTELNFTSTNIKRNYAFSGIGREGRVANSSIGVVNFDGNGIITGIEMLNQPGSSFRERRFELSSIEGTYNVDPRGTGEVPEDGTGELGFRFLITKSEIDDEGVKIAQEITFLPLSLIEKTGNLVLSIATKLPNVGEFSLASFNGTYSFSGVGRGGRAGP